MDKKENIIIAFSQKAESALFDIEKRYNLEEKDEEWVKKVKENKPLNISFVTNLIREFAKSNLSKENFIDSLQKDLGLNSEVAKNIFNDILNNVVPFLDKVSEENMEKVTLKDNNDSSDNQTMITQLGQQKAMASAIKPEKKLTDNHYPAKRFQEDTTPIETDKTYIPKKRKLVKKTEGKPILKSSQKTDKYREQI